MRMANLTIKSVPSTWWTRWRGCPVGRGSVWARGPGTRPRPPFDEWRAGTGCSSISPPDTCTQRKQWNVTHTTSATSLNYWYCEIIIIRRAFNNMEFVGKTIHEFKYQQYKIPSVRLWNARLLVNYVNIWYEPCILQVCNPLIKQWFNMSDSHLLMAITNH